MKINIAEKNNFLIFRIYGELDMNTVPEFKEKIEKAMQEKNIANIILNLQNMNFIDSTGVGALLGRYKKIKKINGEMIIVGVNERVKSIFKISGIYNLLKFYTTEKETFSQIKGGN